MSALVDGGLIEDEIAERYRMTTREVKQQLSAVEFMDQMYFPITSDPTDPEHRTKFSYFLEFYKNGRIQSHNDTVTNLQERFARWVRDGQLNTGAQVRRLPRILDSGEATRLLDTVGFEAANEYLTRQHPEEQELYSLLERTRSRLAHMTVTELIELSGSKERLEILTCLHQELSSVFATVQRVREN